MEMQTCKQTTTNLTENRQQTADNFVVN